MQFSSILEYFIPITVYFLLTYNFLATILFCFKKELLTEKKNIRVFQQFLLIFIFICMIIYHNTATNTTPRLSITPWIWGFLSGHIFITPKKRWVNELLGLGTLLAITIVLFFKQTEIVQVFTTLDVAVITTTVYLVYICVGFVLGAFLWSNSLNK
ncbi:hypothetical protein [Kordia sp.]|uniref:hypothetical protein n=1 Tax=Kordia sp. TaxID=1965332 RepID=UPI003D6BD7C9